MRHLLLAAAILGPSIAQADLRYFGYAGVECGKDDPFTPQTDGSYAAEVAGFTNLNMACVDVDPAVTAARIRALDAISSQIVLNVQPALFTGERRRFAPHPQREALWPLVLAGLAQSGVPMDRIILYLVDEPALNNLPLADLEAAIAFVGRSLPGIRTMTVDAIVQPYDRAPNGLTFWGFDKYFLRDPALDPELVATLDRLVPTLGPDQKLILVMDATYVDSHRLAGIGEADMAEVARAWHRYALARGDVVALIGYSWVGGIEHADEKGLRALPAEVREAHQDIGRRILGR